MMQSSTVVVAWWSGGLTWALSMIVPPVPAIVFLIVVKAGASSLAAPLACMKQAP